MMGIPEAEAEGVGAGMHVGRCAVNVEAQRYDLGTGIRELATLPVVFRADSQLSVFLVHAEWLQSRERSAVERDDKVPREGWVVQPEVDPREVRRLSPVTMEEPHDLAPRFLDPAVRPK